MVHFLIAGHIVCTVFSLQGCEALQSKSELSHNSGSYAHVQFYIFLSSHCSKQGCSFSKLYCKYDIQCHACRVAKFILCNAIAIVSIMSIGATLAIHHWILTCFWHGAS